jgi:carbonic anhydrase
MDTRIDPLQLFDSRPGEIHTIENAGGLVTGDVIRSLLISQRYLGTRKVAIVMHTDCGMQDLDDQAEASAISGDLGVDLPFELGGFDDLHQRLATSVRMARTTPLLPHRDDVRGYIYDVDTRRLTEIPIG